MGVVSYRSYLLLIAVTLALNAQPVLSRDVEHKAPPAPTKAGVEVPPFIRYFQDKHRTPSCYIESRDKKHLDILSFDDDDEEDYSNCSKTYSPTIISSHGGIYAAYKYLEEETRGVFSSHYFYIKLKPNSFDYCQNSDALSSRIKSRKESRGATVEALATLGCTIAPAGSAVE